MGRKYISTATWCNNPEQLKFVLEFSDTHVDEYSCQGTFFPLLIAARYGYYECAKILLEAGANVNNKNAEGKTALKEARQEGHKKLADLLVSYGAS